MDLIRISFYFITGILKKKINILKKGWYGDTFESTGVDNEVADQPLCRYIILDIRNYE